MFTFQATDVASEEECAGLCASTNNCTVYTYMGELNPLRFTTIHTVCSITAAVATLQREEEYGLPGDRYGSGKPMEGPVDGGAQKDQSLTFAGTCASCFPPVMCSRTPA